VAGVARFGLPVLKRQLEDGKVAPGGTDRGSIKETVDAPGGIGSDAPYRDLRIKGRVAGEYVVHGFHVYPFPGEGCLAADFRQGQSLVLNELAAILAVQGGWISQGGRLRWNCSM
jgi:hypothetical protein